MDNSKKSSLNCDDIRRIIDQCAKRGVTRMKFGELQLWFATKKFHVEQNGGKQDCASPQSFPGAEIPAEQIEKQDRQTIEQINAALKQEEIENLLLTDPLTAEQMMLNGELDEDDTEGSDE